MPWKMTFPEDQRVQFIVEALYGDASIADLCRTFSVSRKTAYKWLVRYEQEGPAGLVDRSRAPHYHPNAVPDDVATRIVGLRRAHPTWGPRKLLARLHAREPKLVLPAPSTVAVLLKRNELVRPRRFRRHVPPRTQPFAHCGAPNDVWCVDFKGHFRVGDGTRCDPLTMTDAFSRYLLRCQALTRTRTLDVKPSFESAFREFGLPVAIRSDNGPPFASVGAGGLSRLSVWWVHLGIRPERIRPGKPQENGRHERMHRTLKDETTNPPRASLDAQQLAFDRFRRVFNYERPHEALGQQPPATVYRRSPRPMPNHLPDVTYPKTFDVRRVYDNGAIRWRGHFVSIGKALGGEEIGLEEIADGTWLVRFGPIELGRISDKSPGLGMIPAPSTRRR